MLLNLHEAETTSAGAARLDDPAIFASRLRLSCSSVTIWRHTIPCRHGGESSATPWPHNSAPAPRCAPECAHRIAPHASSKPKCASRHRRFGSSPSASVQCHLSLLTPAGMRSAATCTSRHWFIARCHYGRWCLKQAAHAQALWLDRRQGSNAHIRLSGHC